MIPRYTLSPFDTIWTEQYKFSKWLEVEIAVAEAQEELGIIPEGFSKLLREKGSFDIKRILEIEGKTKHDVIAFLTCIRENLNDPAPYLHYGLTSSDILDTSLALILRDSISAIEKEIIELSEVIKEKILQYKDTLMMGRTHGVHAEPMTVGHKFAIWFDEINRHKKRLEEIKYRILIGKLSGAVGNFVHNPPEVEEIALRKLNLGYEPAASQVVHRDRHAEFICFLALLSGSLDKFMTEIRHLHRTEVQEMEQFFSVGQKGSSAMPHKRNPQVCEQISGLARIIKSSVSSALDNISLWHERDISHSSVERIILPDCTTLAHYLLVKTIDITRNLLIHPEKMERNIGLSNGIFFSQKLLLALVRKSISRTEAYDMVQKVSMRVQTENRDFRKIAEDEKSIRLLFNDEEWAEIFNMESYSMHTDNILKRIGLK
ncbi:MAG: adenylosuccinate lyase [Candidatus Coatesbacteria bacterium]|nr:adenylosuccinate lyase [Candidatus Coatesbacteria bacterium]